MSILTKSLWTDPADFIISDIYEYDMKRGGLSVIKEYSLLPQDEIEKLEKEEKKTATINIGKLHHKHKGLASKMNEGFMKARLLFGELNELQDSDIISIKKDAIFTRKYCDIQQITDNILFREKNAYDAFVRIGKIEFYWSPEKMDVKGINDLKLAQHKDLLDFISKIIQCMVRYDNKRALRLIVQCMNDYKKRRLPIGFYRELNADSKFIFILNEDTILQLDNIGEEHIKELKIEYNYLNILVPLMNLLL